MAQPPVPKPDPPLDAVDDAGDDSFPASDAPSFTPVTGSKPETIDGNQIRKAQRDRALEKTPDAPDDDR